MSLGQLQNNNNQNKTKNSPIVYSGYNFTNAESKVDETRLSFSYWNNMLKMTISPKTGMSEQGYAEWGDDKSSLSIFLTHTKARMLHDEICMFIQNPDLYNNLGVSSGAGLISISNGKELGVSNPCLIIRKLNGETGDIEASYAYEFKQDYHFAIRNFDESTKEFDKVFDNNLEIEQLKTLLMSYYTAMTGAIAYTVMEQSKYNNSRMNTKLDSISEKLGIEYNTNGNYTKKSSGSIFNNKEGRNFSVSTLDDIESQL